MLNTTPPRLRAAVIGVGSMGSNHARIYHDMDNIELVAIVDSSPELAAKVGRRFGVSYFTELETMLDVCQPDLVSVAVPTSWHYQVCSILISHGIHVLVEKPITSYLADAESLIAMANIAGVTLAVGHIERFNPAVAELVRQLRTNKAGHIYQIHSQRLSPYPSRIQDVGVVIDLASHDIDLFRYLMDDQILRVYGETLCSINSTHEDMFSGLMRFSQGAIGVLNVNWMSPTKIRTLTVTGARGMFICNLLSQELVFHENSGNSSEWDTLSILHGVSEGNSTGFSIKRYEPLAAELNDFVNAVIDRGTPLVRGVDGLATLSLALDFVHSGNVVELVHQESHLVSAR